MRPIPRPLFFLIIPRPPSSTLFPYTTLFRSKARPQPQAKFDQIASLFDDVPRTQLRRSLTELLNTPESLLPKRLDEVGDELLFHFYSDGKLRQDFRTQAKSGNLVSPKTRGASAKKTMRVEPAQALAAMSSPRLAAHIAR